MKFTIGKKLLGLVGLLLTLLVVIWALSTISVKRVDQSYKEALNAESGTLFLLEKEVDHLRWVNSLSEAFTLNKDLDIQLDPHKCGFGKWYYGFQGSEEYKSLDDQTKAILAKIEEPHNNLHHSAAKIKEILADSHDSQHRPQALEIFKTETMNSLASVQELFNELKKKRLEVSSAKIANAEALSSSSISINLAITIISLVLGLVLAIFVTRSITKPTNKIVEMLKDIARGEGDLTKRLNINSADELGELAKWYNTFIDKIHDIIAQVAINTEQLASAASEIASSAEELSAGVREQTNQTAQVSTTIDEMTATIVETSKNTGEAAEKAREAASKSQEGSRLAEDTSRGMDEIVQASSITTRNVGGLSEKATAIGEIIKVIDDIADQTNLLALNAAIEAARAGEQGRGFAVVADEVRKLAERTTKATREVAETIKGIQADVSAANTQMVESQEIVNKGKELVRKTNASLTEIFSAIEAAQEMMRQIATASEEQSAAAEQISRSVENVDRITRESATGSEQAAAAAEQLNRQAEELRRLVGGFKLRKQVGSGA